MKLEEGMYVRAKWGYICKIININDFREPTMKYAVEASYLKDIMFIGDDDISKASHNIIDLIEVGDYVNGKKVIDIVENDIYISDYYAESYIGIVKVKDIKSIVTKEMYSSVEYRVETENIVKK